MSMSISFIPEEDLLDLSFNGALDLTVTQAVCAILPQLSENLKTCILDLTRVDRVFDSGIALLRMLSTNVHRTGARVVILADHQDLDAQLSLIRADASYTSRYAFASAMEIG